LAHVMTGMERLLGKPPGWLRKGAKVGLLVHPASVDRGLRPVVEVFSRDFPGSLRKLFGPQHGLWGEKQDNMIFSEHEKETPWGVPAFSLYGDYLAPTEEMLQGLEVLIVDLQDVGCRVYTYAATMLGCLEACAANNLKLVVTDRPNPLGGVHVEGNLLDSAMKSFVGPHPIPMRHGLTLGELARLLVAELGLEVELEVVLMEGWRRDMFFEETGLPWVLPSPNLPTPDSCVVYPGQVLLEGTNLSEGRGTTRPFEIFGAPFIEPFFLRDRLEELGLPGVRFRALYFEPTHNKWKGERCGGLQIHVLDRRAFEPYLTSLWIIHLVRSHWGEFMSWKEPPYEFEARRLPMDLLTGDPKIREGLEKGLTPAQLQARWKPALEDWFNRREKYLAYRN
jgi:uncharacterized protein YbbC (DUF1343 family)